MDIMDRGTDCRDVLLGKSLKLRHGWVAVVNRGQADINNKVGGSVAAGLVWQATPIAQTWLGGCGESWPGT